MAADVQVGLKGIDHVIVEAWTFFIALCSQAAFIIIIIIIKSQCLISLFLEEWLTFGAVFLLNILATPSSLFTLVVEARVSWRMCPAQNPGFIVVSLLQQRDLWVFFMSINAYKHTQVKCAYILLFIFWSCTGMSRYTNNITYTWICIPLAVTI